MSNDYSETLSQLGSMAADASVWADSAKEGVHILSPNIDLTTHALGLPFRLYQSLIEDEPESEDDPLVTFSAYDAHTGENAMYTLALSECVSPTALMDRRGYSFESSTLSNNDIDVLGIYCLGADTDPPHADICNARKRIIQRAYCDLLLMMHHKFLPQDTSNTLDLTKCYIKRVHVHTDKKQGYDPACRLYAVPCIKEGYAV